MLGSQLIILTLAESVLIHKAFRLALEFPPVG